ncbi:hypothetical protein [Kitasatospora sp. NPDC059327]|uniref:hypothetical protein n=1 Tax=Kitasatospora sp. NPDC059327 TaxID=3346803 RepID=UPI0036BC117A
MDWPSDVARRAAQHPDCPEALAILTHLAPLIDDTIANDLDRWQREKIEWQGIALSEAGTPGSPGHEKLGQALVQHAEFFEPLAPPE